MILVIGGRAQGKRGFVRNQLCREQTFIQWADGEKDSWDVLMKSAYIFGLHCLVKRFIEGDRTLGAPEGWLLAAEMGGGPISWEELPGRLASALLEGKRDRIIVTDEIGYGIVPIEKQERLYREMTGRLCCILAKEAEEVWRVCCGIGQRIK